MSKISALTELRGCEGESEQSGPEGPAGLLPPGSVSVGWIAAWTDDGLMVDFEGSQAGPVLARSAVVWRPDEIQAALATRRPVLLAFEQADQQRPVIVGALATVPKPASETTPADADVLQITADAKRVELSARDEVVLRCGEASITLRRNGRVVIKGAYVETRARGTNRIKGGNVLIN